MYFIFCIMFVYYNLENIIMRNKVVHNVWLYYENFFWLISYGVWLRISCPVLCLQWGFNWIFLGSFWVIGCENSRFIGAVFGDIFSGFCWDFGCEFFWVQGGCFGWLVVKILGSWGLFWVIGCENLPNLNGQVFLGRKFFYCWSYRGKFLLFTGFYI